MNYRYQYRDWMDRRIALFRNMFRAITMLCFVLSLILDVVSSQSVSVCDASSDRCPFQGDGECDNQYGLNIEECTDGDCFDCDRCQPYSTSCSLCVENGCFWCPTEGVCLSSTSYKFAKLFSCTEESGYYTSCDDAVGTQSTNLFSDPLYSAELWIYNMINVIPVWEQGITGTGSRVRVNDGYVDGYHDEFGMRFDAQGSCENSIEQSYLAEHGTSVASIIAAGANNTCAVGIAPTATISACYAFDFAGQGEVYLDYKLSEFDISQNSYNIDACPPPFEFGHRRSLQSKTNETLSPSSSTTTVCPFLVGDPLEDSPCDVCDFPDISSHCSVAIETHCRSHFEDDPEACTEYLDIIIGGECEYNTLSTDQRTRLTNAIVNGRDGKGIIFVFAAGNEYDFGEDINFEGYLNSRFTITVGAVGKDGLHASYSTPGAALFLTAPGGDAEDLTTFIVAKPGGECGRTSIGTSFSAPVVSGVIALILEANPELGWRDVQGILAQTSRMVDTDPHDDTRITNAAGISHSNFYGFGIVDAYAAVSAAKTWEIYEPENMILGESGTINVSIPDNPLSPISSAISIETGIANFVTESVVAFLELQHPSRGDLKITLTSPSGTKSVLHPGNRPETSQPAEGDPWKLLTVRNWGESPVGEWVLSVVDISANYVKGTCANFPWKVYLFDVDIRCSTVESRGVCVDGEFIESKFSSKDDAVEFAQATDNGLTALDACCACGGGGKDGTSQNDQLIRWNLVVYGHAKENLIPLSNPTSMPMDDSPTKENTSSSPPPRFNRAHWVLHWILLILFPLYCMTYVAR